MRIKEFVHILDFGVFSKPFLNYIIDSENDFKLEKGIREYIKVLKLVWEMEYEEALKTIDENINRVKNTSIYFLFLCEKMSISNKLRNIEEVFKIYNELRIKFDHISEIIRGIVVEALCNNYQMYKDHTNEEIQLTRFWSKKYEEIAPVKGFILISQARGKKNEGNYIEAAKLNIQAFKTLKDVPHPSGMVGALNNISWWLKDVDKNISLNSTLPLGFYASYYFDDNNYKVFNSLDTIFQVQKNNNDPMVYETAFIFSKCLSKVDKERYNALNRKCRKSINHLKYFVFNLDSNYYLNTKTLRNFIKQEIEKEQVSIKELNISKRTLNDFLSGKRKYLQPNTLRNIIENLEFEINSSLAIPIIKELKKKDIDQKFEENFYKFMRLKIEKQLSEFFTSYLVHYYKQEVKLEKVIKGIESGSLIKERCDYYTRELINSIFEKTPKLDVDSLLTNNQEQKTYTNKDITFKEHPFYLARKELVKRFMKDLNKIHLQEFIENYIKANSKQKDIIERYIMNYGRYYEIKNIPKELTPKVPKEIDQFVKEYTLKRIPSAISFYVFEGKEREELVETLKMFE
ncbi:hypothetical protein [Petrotoga sp. 9PWA.NaAc.5.4]|uniref:hypothetical protein n=1 Tax=Petrotoga sp. 9PWA.NaAc.5.4 TaxID=1434328 RepID=UPI000CA6CC95|nr:hypothetical protein [Petrotoga sp. 9PWA.NaAc.5.4]PNR96284.1 hypothetical protein X924_03145 [Petrotoga sp. 9PWA.NaAc.5.4]